MKLSDYSFRDLYKQCVILKGERIFTEADRMLSEYSYISPPGMDAALCFCYIDSTAGMSFDFLCFANYENGEVDFKSYDKMLEEKTRLFYRYHPDDEVKIYSSDTTYFSERITMVDEGYHDNENVLSTRSIKDIDHLRHSGNPDDILIFIMKDGLEAERPWVRLTEIKEGKLFGTLINEPHQNFGVHYNDVVRVDLGMFEDNLVAVVQL